MATAEALKGQLLAAYADLMVRQQLGLQPQGLADLHPAETSTLSKPNTSIRLLEAATQNGSQQYPFINVFCKVQVCTALNSCLRQVLFQPSAHQRRCAHIVLYIVHCVLCRV